MLEGGTVIEAKDIITDLNIAVTWLEYPGRKNTTAPTDEAEFAG